MGSENVVDAGVILAVMTAFVVCANGGAIGQRLSVMAHPDRFRKRHPQATPQVGGIAIIVGLVTWSLCTVLTQGNVDVRIVEAIVLPGTAVALMGFADDQTTMTPLARMMLLAVLLGVAFVIHPSFLATALNWGSFAATSIPIWLSILLTSLAVVGVVNAVNMADGQNGVAGSMLAVWSGCLFLISSGLRAEMAGVLFLLSLVFLFFNLRGKIFLGDCGSYGITFVLALLVVSAHASGRVSLETVIVWAFIPVADCVRLLISRPMHGRSPFLGDRDHFHHRLEDKMGKHQGLACYAAAVGLSSLVAALEPRFALVCLSLLSAFYFSFAWLTGASIATETRSQPSIATDDNVISLAPENIPDQIEGRAA